MPRITESLIRKRAEHNMGMLTGLTELSLHQEEIEKIEVINQLARHLEILLLTTNRIRRIENLNRLKDLRYLNLAVNRITAIANLEGCESLQKLDLTCNLIEGGALHTVESLKHNLHLTELYLSGNPCSFLGDYSLYIIAHVPTLQRLDGVEITEQTRNSALSQTASLKQMGHFKPQTHLELCDAIGGHSTDPTTQDVVQAPPNRPNLRSRNTGGWRYAIEQDTCRIKVSIDFPKFLFTDSISVDVQAECVTCHAMGADIRLVFDSLVVPSQARLERSTTTGQLVLRVPLATQRPQPLSRVQPPPTTGISRDLPPLEAII